MVDFCLLQAKRSIALCWKNVGCPSFDYWLTNLSSSLALEKLTYIVKKKASEFWINDAQATNFAGEISFLKEHTDFLLLF